MTVRADVVIVAAQWITRRGTNELEATAAKLAGVLHPGDLEQMRRRLRGAARDLVNLHDPIITAIENLATQRHLATLGRPRSGAPGGRSAMIPDPSGNAASEAAGIIATGAALTEALWMLHPETDQHPHGTATHHLATVAAACRTGRTPPDTACLDLIDAVHGVTIAVDTLRDAVRTATRVRAWGPPEPPEPAPVPTDVKCRCGNILGEFPRFDPNTGSAHHTDLCDDCFRLLCVACFDRPHRPGGTRCEGCHTRQRRERERQLQEAS